MKLPMTQAIQALERLDDIELTEDLDLVDLFGDLRTHLEESFRNAVDRRAFVFRNKDQLLSLAKTMREAWQKRERAITNMIERLREDTLAIIETTPGRSFEGEQFKLRLQDSPEALDIGAKLQTVTTSNVISEFDMRDELLPYTELVTMYRLKTDELKAALKSGFEVKGCKLKQSKHVRVGLK